MWSENPVFSAIYNALVKAGMKSKNGIRLPHGAIIAVADLVECWQIVRDVDKAVLYTPTPKGGEFCTPLRIVGDELLFGDYRAGRYAWQLENVRALPNPLPYKGKQGLWECEDITI
jgi:hypothetical protein